LANVTKSAQNLLDERERVRGARIDEKKNTKKNIALLENIGKEKESLVSGKETRDQKVVANSTEMKKQGKDGIRERGALTGGLWGAI